jgi:hypothetical protein
MTELSPQEKEMRVRKAVNIALRIREILDGEQADVIHMTLGHVVASFAKAIDPVSFPDAVSDYAKRIINQ